MVENDFHVARMVVFGVQSNVDVLALVDFGEVCRLMVNMALAMDGLGELRRTVNVNRHDVVMVRLLRRCGGGSAPGCLLVMMMVNAHLDLAAAGRCVVTGRDDYAVDMVMVMRLCNWYRLRSLERSGGNHRRQTEKRT